MDHIEAFLLNPITGLAGALVLMVIGWKLNANAADWVLFCAWCLFSVSIFRTAPISQQVLIQRGLWTLFLASAVGLGLCWLSGWKPVTTDTSVPSDKKKGVVTQQVPVALPATGPAPTPRPATPHPMAQITEQFKAEQRANIELMNVSLLKTPTSINGLVELRNNGKTPATVRASIMATSGGPEESVIDDVLDVFMKERTYKSGDGLQKAGEPLRSRPEARGQMTPEEMRAFDNGDIPTYVYGRVYYEDIFGDKHLNRFCFKWQATSSSFVPYKQQYNEVLHGASVPTPLEVEPGGVPRGKFPTPRLVGRLLALNVIRENIAGFESTDVYVKLQIENLGSTPTIAKGFALTVAGDFGSPNGQLVTLPIDFTLFNNGIPIATFRPDDYLEDKASSPILRGAPIEGWLKFRLAKLSNEGLAKTAWRITFMDGEGKLVLFIGKSLGIIAPQLPPPDPNAKPPAF
jgi:hypothetical protein